MNKINKEDSAIAYIQYVEDVSHFTQSFFKECAEDASNFTNPFFKDLIPCLKSSDTKNTEEDGLTSDDAKELENEQEE